MFAPPALAQPAASPAAAPVSSSHKNVLEEIVVTAARRRREDVQHTPIAVTALSATTLANAHVTSITQIGNLAPNLQILPSVGAGADANFYLRGFGQQSNDPAIDPRIAVFIDGIYQPADVGTLFDLFDVQSVEVQSGPQGTLLGKNAPVGAITITSAPPLDHFGGDVETSYGSYDHYTFKARVSVPLLTDSAGQTILASKFVFSTKDGGNWVYNDYNHKNDFGGEDTQSYRASFAFKPTPEYSWNLFATYTHDESPQGDHEEADYVPGFLGTPQNDAQNAPFPCLLGPLIGLAKGCENPGYGHADQNYTSRGLSDKVDIASNMHYDFGPATATLVTGYESFFERDNLDDPGTPYVSLNQVDGHITYDEETAELRFSSNKGKGADLNGLLDWVGGMYFANYDFTATNHLGIGVAYPDPFPISPQTPTNVNESETGGSKSEAAFAQLIFHFTKQLSGTFGIRQSWDQKSHTVELPGFDTFYVDRDLDFSNRSYEGALNYQITPHALTWVRFAQGYLAGGYDGFSANSGYKPETNNEYEIGAKTDWLDHRLRVNATLFRNELANLQVESAENISTPPFFAVGTLNAGSAISQGVESQIVAVPIDDLTTSLDLGYLDAYYVQNISTTCSNVTGVAVNCSGINFTQAPKWTLTGGASYVMDLPRELGTVTLSGSYAYKSHLFTSDPVYPDSYQKGYGLLGASVRFQDRSQRYTLELYGTNITNVKYDLAFSDPSGLGAWYERGRPAEWGLKLVGKF